MHIFNIGHPLRRTFLVGVEFSVSAFVNPAAWRLEPEPQLKMLSRFASVLGKVMPVWYPVCALLLGIQTWLYWHTPGRAILLTACDLDLSSVASIFSWFHSIVAWRKVLLIGSGVHRIWDKRHRVRIAALAIAALLLTYVVVALGGRSVDVVRGNAVLATWAKADFK